MSIKTKRGLAGIIGLLFGGLMALVAIQLPNILGCTFFSDSPTCGNNPLFVFSGIYYALLWILGPFAAIPFFIVGWVLGLLIGKALYPHDDGLPVSTLNKKHSLIALLLIIVVIAGMFIYFFYHTGESRKIYDPYAVH